MERIESRLRHLKETNIFQSKVRVSTMGKKKRLARNNNALAGQKQLSGKRGSKVGNTANSEGRKKVKKKREVEEFPGLKKNLFSKIKQEYFDFDYLDQLDDNAKRFLSQFNEEHLGANLDTKKNKKYKRKTNLHPKKFNKSVFHANNARNRDIMSNARAGGFLDYEEKIFLEQGITEDDLIDLMDICRDIEEFYMNNVLEEEDLPKFV